jgi:hypothetical protein
MTEAEALARFETLCRAAPSVQHEANNALMVLSSNLELLALGAASEAARRQVGRCEEAQRRLDETLRAFLALLRRAPAGPEPLSLPLVVDEVLLVLRAVLGARMPVACLAAPDMRPARCDRALLEAALLALAQGLAGKGEAARPLRLTLASVDGEARLTIDLPQGLAVPAAALPLLEAATLGVGGRIESGAALLLAWPEANP